MNNLFIVGEMYFRVKYAERDMKYPLLDSFIFVGKNLSEEDSQDTWYFQFADSIAAHGTILESSTGERRVACLNESELRDMLDDKQLLAELSAARGRRKSDAP